MSTKVTPESLRTHALFAELQGHRKVGRVLKANADELEHEIREQQRPLPTVPGWYPTIVVERGGESCTGALLTDDKVWITALAVDYSNHHDPDDREVTVRWAGQDGTTPGQTMWAARWGDGPSFDSARGELCELYEKVAPTLTPVGEHPEPGTRGLLPVKMRGGEWQYKTADAVVFGVYSAESCGILADPRPGGAHE